MLRGTRDICQVAEGPTICPSAGGCDSDVLAFHEYTRTHGLGRTVSVCGLRRYRIRSACRFFRANKPGSSRCVRGCCRGDLSFAVAVIGGRVGAQGELG